MTENPDFVETVSHKLYIIWDLNLRVDKNIQMQGIRPGEINNHDRLQCLLLSIETKKKNVAGYVCFS
jgi:hypothetical protein